MSLVASKTSSPTLDEFDYSLPQELIAQCPLPARSDSRLLTLAGSNGRFEDRAFRDVQHLLQPGDVLVLNDTKVIPARLYGRKATGGRVELLVERVLSAHAFLAMAGTSKPLRVGHEIFLEKNGTTITATVSGRRGDLVVIACQQKSVRWILNKLGHMPLPPYIRRPVQSLDCDRYQTVYASVPGAVAAPTAGLHFDDALITGLEESGVRCVFLTLHVGAGTFQPIRQHSIADHHLHQEWISVPPQVCEEVLRARRQGNKVVAVGTTSVRALETVARTGAMRAYTGETDLFLYPGQPFYAVDAMITNFHLPKSSLLMLVCAFAGTNNTLRSYAHAVRHGYRFYSYGDAMYITPDPRARRCLTSA